MLMLFFSEVATFQNWQAVIRFGADDQKSGDSEGLAKLLKFSIKLDALTALAAYLASLALFGTVVWFIEVFPAFGPENGLDVKELQLYAALYCIVVLARQRGASVGVHRLFDRFKVLAGVALVMPVLRFLGSVYALYAGWGLIGFLCVWFFASLVSYIVLIITAVLELKSRNLLGLVMRAKSRLSVQRQGLWPFVIKSNIDSTLSAGMLHLPALLVMPFFGPVFMGIYRIAEEVAKLLSEGFKLLDQVIYPELAKMVVNGESEKIWRLVKRVAVILLLFGLAMSAFVWFAGPVVLEAVFGKNYAPSAPYASVLVPAAALTGIMAPLFPIFYAADKPERAIVARGINLLTYVISFFVLATLFGKMGAAWAVVVGHAVGVIVGFFMAKQTMSKTVRSERDVANLDIDKRRVQLMGQTDKRIWGMDLRKWQGRAMKKAGGYVRFDTQADADAYLNVNWVLSSELAREFVNSSSTALVIEGEIVGVTGVSYAQAQALIGAPSAEAQTYGLVVAKPEDLATSYNKTLRKTDPPYGINLAKTSAEPVMHRQFKSSYKGITDFVTKYFWPLPAYYVTRLCAQLRLTPNMVTSIGLVLCIAAYFYFLNGQWMLGFLTGWLMTFLDTVDGKLARTTMTYSSWGNAYDHGIDLIHPPFWYYAWFVGLGGTLAFGEPSTWLATPLSIALIAILVGYIVDRIIEGIFIAQHGFHIHVWRPFNSFLRIYTARRNPNTFIFMIFIILSAVFTPSLGIWWFYAVAIWTWACIAINIGVLLIATLSRKVVTSWLEA